jgi:hypothetical protein
VLLIDVNGRHKNAGPFCAKSSWRRFRLITCSYVVNRGGLQMKKIIAMAICISGMLMAANEAGAQSAQCQAAINAYNQRVASHNARCANASTPAQVNSCNAERQSIEASRPNCR